MKRGVAGSSETSYNLFCLLNAFLHVAYSSSLKIKAEVFPKRRYVSSHTSNQQSPILPYLKVRMRKMDFEKKNAFVIADRKD